MREIRIIFSSRFWNSGNANRIPYVMENFIRAPIQLILMWRKISSHTLSVLKYNSFAREQTAFPIQAAGEAAEFFVRGKHAMARNQNRTRVRPARAAYRADGLGLANRRRDFAVA